MTTTCFQSATNLIKDAVANKLIPSAALAIGVKNQVYVQETYGMTSLTKDGTPVTKETLYDMASVTKIMSTTMIALRFLEEGKLTLADSIKLYLGDLVPSDKEDIRIFHLMTHTSGLTPHLLLEEATNNPEHALSIILNSKLTAPIGQLVQYSCMGYITLGKILEVISGKSLDVLAKEYVFDPLDMPYTSYHRINSTDSIRIYPNCAYTERDPKTGMWLSGIVHDENARFLHGVAGNAGVFSNLIDCITFASMLSNVGKTKNNTYLSKATMEAAIHNYTNGQDQNRGLGFHLANGYDSYAGALFDSSAFGHNGFTGPHILVSPTTGLYVILLTNRVHPTRDNSAHLRIRRQLHNVVAAEFSRNFY